MIKKTANFCVILTLLIALTIFYGCAGNKAIGNSGKGSTEQIKSSFPGLDVETEQQIIKEWRKLHKNSALNIKAYLGTYNDCTALLFTFVPYLPLDELGAMTTVTVAAKHFTRFGFDSLKAIWRPGGITEGRSSNFYKLDEAYNLGCLTDDDINNIYEQYQYFMYKEIVASHPAVPGLDPETALQFKKDFILYRPRSDVFSIKIRGYFGIHNGYVPIMIDSFSQSSIGWPINISVSVAGYDFSHNSSLQMFVWKPGDHGESGKIYKLEEVYDAGYLTEEDIKNIHEQFQNPSSRDIKFY